MLELNEKQIIIYFEKHLRKLGVRKNDNLVIHSNLASVGVYHKNLPSIFLTVLSKIIGKKGTFALPLYNYELRKKKIINMDVDYSLKQNSILSKQFFKKFKYSRTSSIFHSHLINGKLSKIFLKNNNFNSFGKNSDFNLFYKNNFKLLLLGCDASQGATYIHHVEDKFLTSYREIKKFKFTIKKKNKLIKTILTCKVRKKNVYQNLNKIFFLPEIKKITKTDKLKFGKSYILKIRALDNLCTNIFKKKPNIINI